MSENIEMVNSPDHYNQGKFETIDIIMDVTQHMPGPEGFLVGNVIKYMDRFYFKGGLEDLEKARWYINKLMELIQEGGSNA